MVSLFCLATPQQLLMEGYIAVEQPQHAITLNRIPLPVFGAG